MTLRPDRSSVVAPAGGATLVLSPMRSMVPLLMMMVWLGREGAPVPSMTLTLVRATTGASTLM